MNENDKKKEQQIDDLTNLIENHTRTERHLEQYSEIGDKEKAREKQDIREDEINVLKKRIINNNETKVEQVQNLVDNYKKEQSYMEDNYEKLSKEDIENIESKQKNRKEQIENLSENIYENNEE